MSTISPTDAFNYFMNAGLPSNSSAAIVGNLFGESGLNTTAVGDNGAAIGIAQWHDPRQTSFENLYGISIGQASADQQLGFVVNELQTSYKSTYNTLLQGGSVEDMTKAFMTGYERPANLSSLGARVSAAKNVLAGATKSMGASLTNTALEGGELALNAVMPGVGSALKAGLNVFGVGNGESSKSWLQQFIDWITNSHFWQRIALGILALIFIGGAIFLIGNKVIKSE